MEEKGLVLLDAKLAALLKALVDRHSFPESLARASLSAAEVRRWRRSLLNRPRGRDPLERRGRSLAPSAYGLALLEEYRRKDAALRVHMASGLRVPLLAVDGLAVYEGKLVAIKRRYYPHEGLYCLPGGMVDYGERVEDAVVREVREETGLDTKVVSLIGVYSEPDRDPRGHVISLAYALEVVSGTLVSGTDAAKVGLLDLEDLPEMGFDHREIVADYVRQLHR